MPSRKDKGPATSSIQSTAGQPESTAYFPFARYTSIVGVHTSLLAFSALLLPSTSSHLGELAGWDHSGDAADVPRRDVMQLLTENPVRTMAWICLGALILQAWWASWMKQWANDAHIRKLDGPEQYQQRVERKEWSVQLQPALVFGRAAATTLVASVAFYVLTVLFGAPLTSHPLQTYSMSLLVAILTVLPPAYVLGTPSLGSDSPALVSRLTWVRLFAELSPRTPIERALVYPAVCALTGSWAGALPIGLDWERPWQAWPLTPTFGAVGGFIVGSLAALAVSATLELAKADPEFRPAQRQAQAQAAPQTKKSMDNRRA